MPSTVSACFVKFRENSVDLPTDQTATARASRDFLFDQIKSLSASTILTGSTINFGSFARRTKMRPLDDIDCFAMLSCANTTESHSIGYTYNLVAKNNATLYAYADSYGYVNSTKVLNAVKTALQSVSQYKQSDIGRDGSAVGLNLKSYDWSFDVVPACPVSNANGDTTHYLIPDGSGKWKRTDPRVDANRTSQASGVHNGRFLPSVRLMKYWNRRVHKPRLPSYYFETLLTNRAISHSAYASLQNAIEDLLYGVRETVLGTCNDPKGYEPNLDRNVDYETKKKVYSALNEAWLASRRAIEAEIAGNHKDAISNWQSIFGPDFPAYG